MFVVFPLKSVFEERRARLGSLEDRVDTLETKVERLRDEETSSRRD
ncbi:MAG: hypothetical protein V5A27_08605 [Halapricum sp.]